MFKIMQAIDHITVAVVHPKTLQASAFSFTGFFPVKLLRVSANITATFLALILFAGCAANNSAQIESSAAPSVVCTAASDAFCVEGNEDSAARFSRRGIEQVQEENFDQALGLFKQAIELDSTNPEHYYNLGVAYNFKKMPVETEATYMAGLAIQPSNSQHALHFAKMHFNLACLYAMQGKKDAALEQLEQLFMVDPKLLFHWVEADPDLDSLRDDPRFKRILARRDGEASNVPKEAGQIEESGQPN